MALTKVSYAMIDGATFNILDFGASPSATAADNTTAIQAAIDAANAAGGGAVYIPSGTYNLATGGVIMKSNVTVFGDGYASKLQGPDFIIGVHSGANPPSASAALTNCEIRDIHTYCTYTDPAYQDSWCIYFFINNVNQTSPTVRGSNIRVLNCYVNNSGSSAIMFSGFSDILIQGNTVLNSGENAIEVQAFWDANYYNTGVRIVDNVVDTWGNRAVGGAIAVFGRNEGLVVADNIINGQQESGSLRGISIFSANFPTATIGSCGSVSNNAVSNCAVGIQDNGTNRIVVSGNTVNDCTTVEVIKGVGSVYLSNRIVGSTNQYAFGNPVQVANPEVLFTNTNMPQFAPLSTYNWVQNGSFNMFSGGNTTTPNYWSDAAGDGQGSVTWSSIGHSAQTPPIGNFACQIVSAAGGYSALRQFLDVDKLKGHYICFTAWVKSATADSCKIAVLTSSGLYRSDYAATGSGTEFVPVSVAAWVDSTDLQVSVRLETNASVTAHWAGVAGVMDTCVSYSQDNLTKQLPITTVLPLDTPADGTVILSNITGTVQLKAYVNGAWKSVTLS